MLPGNGAFSGYIFNHYRQNVGIEKIDCFSDLAFSVQNRLRTPQSEHHRRSGAQKVAKTEPNIMTFRGHAKKLKSEPGLRKSPVEAVPGGPRITQKLMLFLKALPEAHFSGPGGPKKAAKADLRPNRADLGTSFGPLFGLIGDFLGVCILGRF